MLRLIGWIVLYAFGLLFVFNSIVMIVSPRTWFRLPEWIGLQGSLTETRDGQGLGIQVRILGAVWLSVIGWVVYDSVFRH